MFLRYLYLTYHTSERQSGDFHASSQGCRERRTGGHQPPPTHPPTISWSKKKMFYVKLKNITFLHVNNIWDFSLFIKQDLSDKHFSGFVVLAVNWATTVTNNQFVSFLFLIETFVKTNSNLICGSFLLM